MNAEYAGMLATDVVTRGMAAMLPEGCLSLFTLLSATWKGSGLTREAIGRVTMFDGTPAVVAVGVHAMGGCYGWTHRWPMLDGAYSLDDGQWVRVADPFTDAPSTPEVPRG